MKTVMLWSLVAINAILLGVVVHRYVKQNAAMAQGRPADYLAIPAQVSAAPNGILFLVDTSNRQLSAVTLTNATQGTLEFMPKIDLDPLFNQGPAPAGGGGTTPRKYGR